MYWADLAVAKNIAFDKNRALFVSALDLYSKLGQFELLGSGVALSVQVLCHVCNS